MAPDLKINYDRLFQFAADRDFAGHDPFDGLNSRVFQWTPLKYSALARLAWLQGVKRGPSALRRIAIVPEGHNPKGLALFALAEMSRYRQSGSEEHAARARDLANRLFAAKIDGRGTAVSTMSFGYNFDWQSRVLWAPKGTPAAVPTAFASQAFFEAHTALGDESYAHSVQKIAAFITTDLNRTVDEEDEVCFSYTPGDHSQVFNASLLAAECLARAASLSPNDEYAQLAERSIRFVVRRQRADGSWAYGSGPKQSWVDNFHTAYVLLSIRRITQLLDISDETFGSAFDRGLSYWLDSFFLPDGTPKYYHDQVYPIDIHAAAVAISALSELGILDRARHVTSWAIANMLDERGFFYYQLHPRRMIRTPFMRWGQAWMAYALARLIEAEGSDDGND